jgi:hypothetical protein
MYLMYRVLRPSSPTPTQQVPPNASTEELTRVDYSTTQTVEQGKTYGDTTDYSGIYMVAGGLVAIVVLWLVIYKAAHKA